jgi:hypothetical protein
MAPIKLVVELVPFDVVYRVICRKISKLCYPGNPTLTSWCDPLLLKAIAEEYCGDVIVPSLVAGWSKATGGESVIEEITAPPKPAEQNSAEAPPIEEEPAPGPSVDEPVKPVDAEPAPVTPAGPFASVFGDPQC